jgi:hypothetical protein
MGWRKRDLDWSDEEVHGPPGSWEEYRQQKKDQKRLETIREQETARERETVVNGQERDHEQGGGGSLDLDDVPMDEHFYQPEDELIEPYTPLYNQALYDHEVVEEKVPDLNESGETFNATAKRLFPHLLKVNARKVAENILIEATKILSLYLSFYSTL